MPRKKTEELAVMPEAPALPVVPEEAAEQPVTEECLPETAADPVVEDTVPTENVLAEPAEVVTVPEDPQPSEKPKRTVRKRTAAKKTVEVEKQATPPTEDAAVSAEPAPAAVQQRDILTLDARGEAETQAQMEDIIWHEMCATSLGKLCASDHAMNAIDEMSDLNRDIKRFFDENGAAYPVWQALEAEAGRYLR